MSDTQETAAAAFDALKAKVRQLEAAVQGGSGTAPAGPTAADFDALSSEIESVLSGSSAPLGGSSGPAPPSNPTPVPVVNPGDTSAPTNAGANTLPAGVVSAGSTTPAPSQGVAQSAINSLSPVG